MQGHSFMVLCPHDPVPLAPWFCYPSRVSHWAFFFNLHLAPPMQSFPRLHIPPLPGRFLPPLFSEHSVWLLYTKITKWMVHSLRTSFFIIILRCYLNMTLLQYFIIKILGMYALFHQFYYNKLLEGRHHALKSLMLPMGLVYSYVTEMKWMFYQSWEQGVEESEKATGILLQ